MPTTKTYISYKFPGVFFAEESTKEVKVRNDVISRPDGAYGFQYYDITEQTVKGESLKGKPKNYSPMTYWGEIYPLKRLKEEYGHEKTLVSNIEGTYKAAVKCVTKNWQPLEKGDRVIDENGDLLIFKG